MSVECPFALGGPRRKLGSRACRTFWSLTIPHMAHLEKRWAGRRRLGRILRAEGDLPRSSRRSREKGALSGKVGGAFASDRTQHWRSGKRRYSQIHHNLLALGMVVVGHTASRAICATTETRRQGPTAGRATQAEMVSRSTDENELVAPVNQGELIAKAAPKIFGWIPNPFYARWAVREATDAAHQPQG